MSWHLQQALVFKLVSRGIVGNLEKEECCSQFRLQQRSWLGVSFSFREVYEINFYHFS